MPAIARHRFVRLDPGAAPEPAMSCAGVEAEMMNAVCSWVEGGMPLVVRRRGTDEPAGILPLAVTLPARLQRRRIALRSPARSLRRVDDPPLLRDAVVELPERSRAVVRELSGKLDDCGVTARVFGSLAWQWLTGERYLHDRSDVDLILEPIPGFDIGRCRRVLERAAGSTAPRFDGEIALDRGDSVSWREWCGVSPTLLVKGQTGASLVARGAIEARLPAASAHAGRAGR